MVDILVYMPPKLEAMMNESKTWLGGVMTLLVPVVLAIYFALVFTNNATLPDVAQPTVRNMDDMAPLQVSVSCTTRDAGGNANPFCPLSGGRIAPPTGFQFVPTLAGTTCTNAVPRAANRSALIPWITAYTSPAVYAVEVAQGVPPSVIGGTSDAFQLLRFKALAGDMSVQPEATWVGAGQPLTALGAAPPPPFAGDPVADMAAIAGAGSTSAALPGRVRTQLLAPDVSPDDVWHAAAAAAAAAPATTVHLDPVPLCPFPDVVSSASINAYPSTAGMGYVLPLPPYFNWSTYVTRSTEAAAAAQLSHAILPTPDGLITAPVRIRVHKGVSTLGGSPFSSELQVWQWFARTMSYTTSANPQMPFIAYAVDVTRTTFANGSAPVVEATASVTSGLMTHNDALNYYGYGAGNRVLPLAACGDLYFVTFTELQELYNITVAAGWGGSWADFQADTDSILSDMLPPTNDDFMHGCDEASTVTAGWPVPTCTAAQAARAALSSLPPPTRVGPLTLNVTDAGLLARLTAVYTAIHTSTGQAVHENMLPGTVVTPDVRAALWGWQNARVNANSIAAMMQAQHGCGLYCAEPLRGGVGSTSAMWMKPTAAQTDPTATGGPANYLAYVQRRRPTLLCDNTTVTLPWTRADPNEYYNSDFSTCHQGTAANTWQVQRLAAPMAVVLFRTASWTEVHISSTRQSVLTLIGSTLGISGTIIAALLAVKRYFYVGTTIVRKISTRDGAKLPVSRTSTTTMVNPMAAARSPTTTKSV